MTQKEISKRAYLNRRKNGLCPRCGKALDRDGFYCSDCVEKVREYNNATRRFLREVGICPSCRKNKLFGDEHICTECLAKKAEYNKTYHKKHKEANNKRSREYHKTIYQQRVEKGICTRCGKRRVAPMKKKCRLCLDKDARIQRLRRES